MLHCKNRALETSNAHSYIGYSWMNTDDRKELDAVLETADPKSLSKLKPDAFAARIAQLYSHLDPDPQKPGRSLYRT
jgi:hypothetical protein